MAKNNQFKITITYNTNGNSDLYYATDCIYQIRKGQVYKDQILITNQSITITGTRTSQSSLKLTMDSKIFNELWKTFLFIYLTQGIHFTIGEAAAIYHDQPVPEFDPSLLDFKYFSEDLDSDLLVNVENARSLFDYSIGDKILVSFTQYIIGIYSNYEELNEFWKAYDSYYKFTTGQSTDRQALEDIQKIIKDTFNDQSLSCRYLQEHSEEFKERISIYYYYKTNPKNKKKQPLEAANDIKNKYSDLIINELANEFIKTKVKGKRTYNKAKENIINRLLFLVTDYIYLKRCSYFHGKEATPVFLLKDNSRIQENILFNNLIKYTLADLYNSGKLNELIYKD